jgi:hypothetical protein
MNLARVLMFCAFGSMVATFVLGLVMGWLWK